MKQHFSRVKSAFSRISKSALALTLALLMLFGTMATSFAVVIEHADLSKPVITRDKADLAESGTWWWTGGNYYLYGGFNSWNNSTTALKMTEGTIDGTGCYYADVYLCGKDGDQYFRFYENETDGTENIQPNNNGNDLTLTTSYQYKVTSGTSKAFKVPDVSTTDKQYYQVRIFLSYGNNFGVKMSKTDKGVLTPTITTKKGSTNTESFTVGDTVSLSTASTNAIGTVSYSYRYKIGSGDYQNITGTSFAPASAGTYTIEVTATDGAVTAGTNACTARTATATKEITVAAANEKLPTPNLTLSSSSVTASPTGSVTLTVSNHATITGKDSGVTYELYKNGTKVTQSSTTYTYSNGVFTIPARYSNNASTTGYSVKAIAANTTNYSDSDTSAASTLTISRTNLARPTISLNKSTANNTDTGVTVTVTNYAALKDHCTFTLSGSTASGGINSSGVYTLTTFTSSSEAGSNNSIKVTATLKTGESEYYTINSSATSSTSTAKTLKVYKPTFALTGGVSKVSATGFTTPSSDDWTKKSVFVIEGTSSTPGVYSLTFTTTEETYLGLHNGTNRYSVKVDGISYNTYDLSYTIPDAGKTGMELISVSDGSMKFAANKTYTITVDQTNSTVSVSSNNWSISTVARYKDYDLTKGTYKAIVTGTTGGTASAASTSVVKGSSTTLTASAKSGYTFTGWYTNEACTTAAPGTNTATSYTATPTADTTYYALFTKNEPAKVNISVANIANATITAKWNNQTKTNGESLSNVPVGASVTVTVTPASSQYYVSAYSPTLSGGKFTVTAQTTTISATIGENRKITTSVNKKDRGSVTVSPEWAHAGQTVTVTVTETSGVLTKLTWSNGSTTTQLYPTGNGTNNVVSSAAAPSRAKEELAESGAVTTKTFTMPSSGTISVRAEFSAYSAESAYYYNGYGTDGKAKSGYYEKQMTEGMVNGQKFSYYEVTGRENENYDQCFTVSLGKPGTDNGYVYFTRPTDWNAGWSASNNVRAYFWNDSGSTSGDWPGIEMTWTGNNDYGQGIYKTAIPAGSKYVKFSDGNGKRTVQINVTTTGGAYYLAGGGEGTDANGYVVGEWNTGNSDQGYKETGTEYKWNDGNNVYGNDFWTRGFNDHDNWMVKPADDGNGSTELDTRGPAFSACKSDYYIVVFYPNTKYTISYGTHTNTEITIGSTPRVAWMATLPGGDSDSVRVYAKDGSIRSETVGVTYANIADTKIYSGSTAVGTSVNGNIAGQTYETYKAEKGETIVIKTKIGYNGSTALSNKSALQSKYYVRGFCVNGEVPKGTLNTSGNTGITDGEYTLTYTIPEDFEGNDIEITPIYYLVNTTSNPVVTFRVQGFTEELQAIGTGKPGWGNTLYAYPFYGALGSNNNAFGAYPGQPLVYYNGQYQMQIPEKSTAWDPYYSDSALSGYSTNTAKANAIANTYVSGITMSNGYYDSVHRSVMGYGDDAASADHVQTYDYDDFYKIMNEKDNVDNIVYQFKYETKLDNREKLGSTTTYTKANLISYYDTNGNGFELLKNYHGRNVDLFGTPLSGDAADPTKTTPVYVISIAGPNGTSGVANIAGYYATEWAVFASTNGTNYTRVTTTGTGGKTSIPPSVLILNDDDTNSFNTTTYPSAVSTHKITDWKALYTKLEAYRNKPVYITYESAQVQVSEDNYSKTGSGGATRNDGRWLYSSFGENITSTIRVDYSDNNGETWVQNPASGADHRDGLSAYFTNTDAYGETTYATTIDPDKTFDFEAATTNHDYKFVGWYLDDGTKVTTDNVGSTERSGSYTLVARFKLVTEGQLVLTHSADTNATYTGSGTTSMDVVVKDGEGDTVRTYSGTSVTLDEKIINSDNGDYTVEVTLNAEGTGDDTYATTTCSQSGTTFFPASYTMGNTFSFHVSDLYTSTTQNVKSIVYNSYFNQVKYDYKITFNFTSKRLGDKTYVREGTLTPAQASNTDYLVKIGSTRTLKAAFINTIAPYESNFNQSLEWTITDKNFAKSGTNYTLTASFTAKDKTTADQGEVLKSTTRTATFKLPYAIDANGAPTQAEGSITKIATPNSFAIDNLTYAQLAKVNNNFIAAPKSIKDGSNTVYFQYWSVASTQNTEVEVARCYFNEFNFVVFDNYVITPVYGTSEQPASAPTSASVSYLETSRNQFNGTGATTNDKNTAADLLFNDFVLSYRYNDGTNDANLCESTDDSIKIGFVSERVQELSINQDGSYVTDPTKYSEIGDTEANIKSKITDVAINGNNNSGNISVYNIDKSELDNKDRIEFYYALYNSGGWNKDTQKAAANYAYKRYVYKAYAYIIVDGEITLSENPVYFTMYDEAAK